MRNFKGLMSKVNDRRKTSELSRYAYEQFRDFDVFNFSELEHDLTPEEQRTINNQGIRLFFYRLGCDVCPMWEEAVREVNPKLPRGHQIIKIDIESEHPMKRLLKPAGTPQLYLDGIVIRGSSSVVGNKAFLNEYFKEEKLLK